MLVRHPAARPSAESTGTPDAGYYELELLKVRSAAAEYPGGEEKVLYKNAARIFRLEEE